MTKLPKILLLMVLIASLFITLPALAKIGVGVGLGKIQIDEPLLPGGIYKFPTIPVLNTGDEQADYEMDVTYHHEQPELRPEKNWFIFTPQTFTLAGGGSQPVEVRLNLPVKTRPGDYFAYLEAHPITTGEGGVTIGIAAATKLNFTVEPANIWQAMIHKISSFLTTTAPTSYIILAVLVIIVLIIIFRKYFAIGFTIRRKKTEPEEEQKQSDHEKKD